MIEKKQTPGLIHLAGADGTGKTTQARAIMAWLAACGVPAQYVWLRYPRYVTIPFLAYARLRGFSRQEVVDGNTHGYWDFERSWLMTHMFPWAILLDSLIIAIIGIYLPRRRGLTVVADRFVGDILVDVMTGLKDLDFDQKLPGRLFLRLLPAETRLIVLELDTEIARQRSPELKGDRSQPYRRTAYLGLAMRQGWPLVSSDAPVDVVTQRIVELIEGGPGNNGSPEGHAVTLEA